MPAGPRVIWRVAADSPAGIAHAPAANADGSMLYFASASYRLKKLSAGDGRLRLDVSVGPVVRTPVGWNLVLAADVVVLPKAHLYAYDTATGARRWAFAAHDSDQVGFSTIATDGTVVYALSRLGRLYAIDARSGRVLWIRGLGNNRSQGVTGLNAAYSDGQVFACTRAMDSTAVGVLWALDARTGATRWSYRFQPLAPAKSSFCFGAPAFWRDLVIEPQHDGRVFAFDRVTGAVRWIAPPSHDPGRSATDVRYAATGGNHLVVTSSANEGSLVLLDPATGAERWRSHEIRGIPLGRPVLDDSSVYLDYGAFFVAFELASGRIRWKYPSTPGKENPLSGMPVVARDRLFFAGRDGAYAISK